MYLQINFYTFLFCSACDAIIPQGGRRRINTDIQIQLPEGTYGRIAARSGLALDHGIDVGGGVIDADYTGNVGVILFNHGSMDLHVFTGMRIAQLLCEKIDSPKILEVETLEDTDRGSKGFGSTGTA